MVSWYSDKPDCDVGGATQDDFRDLIQKENLTSDVSNPNFYDTYSVEIKIGMFAINSICSLDELHNIDKEASRLDTRGISNEAFENLDDFIKTKNAYKLLKIMVSGWIEDILTTQNELADLLL